MDSKSTTALEQGGARVLVTGATGYVGANVVAALLADPRVAGVVAGVRDPGAGEALAAALGSPGRLSLAVGSLPEHPWALEGVDTLVHGAGVRPGADADDTRVLVVNQEGTRRLLEGIPASGVGRVVFVSAQSVYGWQRRPPHRETQPPRPQTTYGVSKWVGEFLCRSLPPGIAVASLRLARVYGLGIGHRLVWTRMPHRFALLAARGETIPVFGDGEQRLDLVHVSDVADAVCRAALGRPAERRAVLNVGGGDPVPVLRIAELCRRAAVEAGRSAPEIAAVPEATDRAPDFGLDIERARRVLGWEPARQPSDGLRELVLAAAR